MNGTLKRYIVAVATLATLAFGPWPALAAQNDQTAISTPNASTTTTTTATSTAAATATAATATSTSGASTSTAAKTPPPLAPNGHATVRSVPPGFTKTSENSTLALYVEKATGQIALQDKRSGLVWLSNPRTPNQQAPSANANSNSSSSQQETAAVYFMNYTDYQRQVVKLMNSAWDNTPPQISALPDGGTRVKFTLQQQQISFAMDYHLSDGYFDVTIPQDQIQEHIDDSKQTGFYLVNLEPLPFFGAGADDEQGYMLVPDGSGALVHFKKIHPDYLQPFDQEVYSPDTFMAFEPKQGQFITQEPVMFPAFGIAKQNDETGQALNGAFLGLVTKGDDQVYMDVSPSGYITRYNHAGAQFEYRIQANFPRSRGVTVTRVALPMTTGDRTVRYYLLNGDQATYSGMASAYRQYLMNSQHVPQLTQAEAPLNLDLLMGAQKKGLISYTLVPATSFANAQTIIDALRQRGVDHLQVTLNGWNRDGYGKASPNRMPADNRLGGNSGLTGLVQFANNLHIPVYLLDDFSRAYTGEKGYFAHNDAVRGANKLPAFSSGVAQSQYEYILNPIVEYNEFVLRDVPKEKSLGANGLDINWFGKLITYDTNEQHALSRAGYIQWNNKIIDYVNEQLGHVAVEGGNVYLLGHTQDVRSVSVDSSHYQFEDEPVPFYEMVMHGFVNYTGKYANLRSDPQFEFLREIEYGARPSFYLTYLNTSDLNRAFAAYRVWSSTWTDWVDTLVREYQDVTVQLGSTTNQFIVDHRQLADGVYQTTYGNGVKVIVNYSDQRYAAGSVAVDPLSYAVINPNK